VEWGIQTLKVYTNMDMFPDSCAVPQRFTDYHDHWSALDSHVPLICFRVPYRSRCMTSRNSRPRGNAAGPMSGVFLDAVEALRKCHSTLPRLSIKRSRWALRVPRAARPNPSFLLSKLRPSAVIICPPPTKPPTIMFIKVTLISLIVGILSVNALTIPIAREPQGDFTRSFSAYLITI